MGVGPARSRLAGAGAALVPVAVMLVIGLCGLDRGSMWIDEEVSYDVSRRSLPQLWALVQHVDVVHAAYYALLHLWMLPGGGEVWMRVPSVLGAAASAGLVAALGSRLVGPRAGLVAGLVFAALPFVSTYAQEGRSFALVSTAVLLATYSLVRALETGGRWWTGYLGAMVVAQTLHEFAVLALLAHGLTLALLRVSRPVYVRWLGCALVCGLLVAPLAVASSRQSGQIGWVTRPTWSTVGQLWHAFAGSAPVGVGVVSALVLVGTLAAPRAGIPVAAVGVPLLVVPPAVLLLASQVEPLFVPRYVFFSVAAVALLAGAGIDRLASVLPGGRAADLVCVAALVAVFVIELPALRQERTVDSRHEDLAGAAQIVAKHAEAGDGVLFLRPKYRAVALGYPRAFVGLSDLALAGGGAATGTLMGTDRPAAATVISLLAEDRIWVLGRPGLSLGRSSSAAAVVTHALTRSFREARRYRVHGMEVALFVRQG